MVALGVKNLLHTKSKSVLSVTGVALSLFLVVVVYGVYDGMDSAIEEMVLGTGASVWVTQEGTSGSVHSPSLVRESLAVQIGREEGIREATGLIRTAVTWDAPDGSAVLLFLNGFHTEGSLGAPWSLREGGEIPRAGQIAIDSAFARKFGLSIGDGLKLQGDEYQIVGLTSDTNLMVGYQVFMPIDEARRYLPAGVVNGILILGDGTLTADQIAGQLTESYKDVEITGSDDLVVAYKAEVLGSFRPIILLLSGVSVLVGVLVVSLLIYMLTLEKSREYTVLKASGASNGFLYRVVLSQAILVSVAGALVGALVSPIFLEIIRRLVPEFVARIALRQLIIVSILFVASSALSSLIPLRLVLKIDPALAFK